MGAGAFGRVVKGEATGIDSSELMTVVAVKMVKSHGNMIGLKALMSELKYQLKYDIIKLMMNLCTNETGDFFY